MQVGQIVPISAIPSLGYQFSYWASSTASGFISFGSVTSAVTTAQISGTGSITANFIQIQTGQNYQVTFSTNGGGSSSTTNPTGTQTYAAGTIVPISATAGSGYQFSSWSSTGSISFDASTSASTNALINGEGSIIANFITPQTGQNLPGYLYLRHRWNIYEPHWYTDLRSWRSCPRVCCRIIRIPILLLDKPRLNII